jgi:N-acetylmuramoyl-L-alanine amidase
MLRIVSAPLAGLALTLAPAAAIGAEELPEEARCLALAMYWEAKDEGREGMLAVGAVVLNRMGHEEFPDAPCEVVREGGETPPCQFSWWCDGASDQPQEQEAWSLAQELAVEMLKDPPEDPTGGALFFHDASIEAPWREERVRTVQIGGHVFYR